MSAQTPDVRRERARLGGLIGGPIVQQMLKEQGAGWYNFFRKRGKKGAAVNREQGTGAYDPANFE